jgi:hypothetical protein
VPLGFELRNSLLTLVPLHQPEKKSKSKRKQTKGNGGGGGRNGHRGKDWRSSGMDKAVIEVKEMMVFEKPLSIVWFLNSANICWSHCGPETVHNEG